VYVVRGRLKTGLLREEVTLKLFDNIAEGIVLTLEAGSKNRAKKVGMSLE
jgi:hypothetical protein